MVLSSNRSRLIRSKSCRSHRARREAPDADDPDVVDPPDVVEVLEDEPPVDEPVLDVAFGLAPLNAIGDHEFGDILPHLGLEGVVKLGEQALVHVDLFAVVGLQVGFPAVCGKNAVHPVEDTVGVVLGSEASPSSLEGSSRPLRWRLPRTVTRE